MTNLNNPSFRKKAIFFDVDDTLYSQFDLTCRAIQQVLALYHVFPFHQAYDRIAHYGEVLSEGILLHISTDDERAKDMRIRRFILALQEFGVSVSFQRAEAIQSEYTSLQRSMKPFEGALNLIAKLTAMGFMIGLITNGNESHQMGKIKTLGLLDYIPQENILISGSIGWTKPDLRIFERANFITGTLAADSIYVGDSWSKDVIGGLNAGWDVIWFNDLGRVPDTDHGPYRSASNYQELSDLLII